MCELFPLFVLTGISLAVAIITTSSSFIKNGYEYLEEFKNISADWESKMDSCLNCSTMRTSLRTLDIKSYPKTWILISTIGIWIGFAQLILLFIGFVGNLMFRETRSTNFLKCCLAVTSLLFVSCGLIFIIAIGLKAKYGCPLLAERKMTKYNCDTPTTYGRALWGLLGANCLFCFICIIHFYETLEFVHKRNKMSIK